MDIRWESGVAGLPGAARTARSPIPEAAPQSTADRFQMLPEDSIGLPDSTGWTPCLEDLEMIADAATAYYGLSSSTEARISLLEITRSIAGATPVAGEVVTDDVRLDTMNNLMAFVEEIYL